VGVSLPSAAKDRGRLILAGVFRGRLFVDQQYPGFGGRWLAKTTDWARQLTASLRHPAAQARTGGPEKPEAGGEAEEAASAVEDVVFVIQQCSMPYVRHPCWATAEESSTEAAQAAPMDIPAPAPVLSMARALGCPRSTGSSGSGSGNGADFDPLFPNPFFGTPADWERIRQSLLGAADAQPFASRKRRAFWRGACETWPGSAGRTLAVALADADAATGLRGGKEGAGGKAKKKGAKGAAGALDFAFTRKCKAETWPAAPSDLRKAVSKLSVKGFSKPEESAKHQFFLHLPGATQGSYSRNLQTVLGLGGVVLQWDAAAPAANASTAATSSATWESALPPLLGLTELGRAAVLAGPLAEGAKENEARAALLRTLANYEEFYYHLLRPGEHYLSVAAANLSAILASCAEVGSDGAAAGCLTDAADAPRVSADTVAAAARAWFRDVLTPEFLVQHWVALLKGYRSVLGFAPSLKLMKKPCTCTLDAVVEALAAESGVKVTKCSFC
jgi:hypothetical protein